MEAITIAIKYKPKLQPQEEDEVLSWRMILEIWDAISGEKQGYECM